MKIVQVDWIDITSSINWHSQNKLDKWVTEESEKLVHQIGYLYEEDENQIVLLDSYFDNKEMYGNATKIPKGCIISVTELRKK